jgi:hypothetical protein
MPQAPAELTVITKMYQLLVWTANHVAKFPRCHRATIGDRLGDQAYLVLDKLLRAKYTRERAPLLREANLELEVLRVQFRLAKDVRCLSVDSYGYAAGELLEVGQMVGGWLRKAGDAAPPAG